MGDIPTPESTPSGAAGPFRSLSASIRHPADYRDAIEHAEVAQVLAELPADHPARVAYSSGAREAADSLSLSHLLSERMDLVARLVAAYMGHSRRIQEGCRGAAHLSSRE